MLSFSLGPIALPVRPLLLMASVLLATWLADRISRREDDAAVDGPAVGGAPGRILTYAVLIGLVIARAVHVALHAEPYLAQPFAAFDLRDGGWHLRSGLVAALAWTGWQAWRRPASRRAIASGAAAGLILWGGGSAALWLSEPVRLPELAFADLDDGRVATLAERAAGRPLVLNLWASWCGPCRKEMPVLAQAQAAHPEVVFVFVNQGESAEVVRRWLSGQPVRLSGVVLDEAARAGRAVGSIGLPTTMFYDAGGTRVGAHLGALNAAALAARLAELEAR